MFSTNSPFFMQNEPNFQKSQFNASKVSAMNYGKMDTWSIGKNEPKTNPNEPNSKKVKMNVSIVLTTDYENISNWAKRTQFKPNFSQKMQKKTQFKPSAYPQEIAFSMACELVKITRPGDTSGSKYMTKASLNNWKAEKL
jgi:hypothetical protein